MKEKTRKYAAFAAYFERLIDEHVGAIARSDLAIKLNSNQPTISKIYGGDALPSEEMIDRIKEIWGVDIRQKVNEIRRERNQSLRGIHFDKDTETLCLPEPEPTKSYDQNVGVPFYDTTFELGFDELENDQTRNPDYMIDFEPYNKCSAWVNARGDSMAPTISGGDILALKEIKDFRYLINDEVYGVVTRNGLRTIKRIRDNGNTFTLIPDNKNYAPQDIDKKEVLRVFQVMGCMKMF